MPTLPILIILSSIVAGLAWATFILYFYLTLKWKTSAMMIGISALLFSFALLFTRSFWFIHEMKEQFGSSEILFRAIALIGYALFLRGTLKRHPLTEETI